MNSLFEKGREGFGAGDIDWDANKFKVVLVDMNDAGPAAGAWVVTGVTNAVNPTITTSAAHGLVVGEVVNIFSVGGATGVNGSFTVATVPTSTTFTITATAPGVYTSGGFIANMSKTFLSEFVPSGGRVSTSPTMTGKTNVGGVLDAADVTFASVTGDPSEALVIVRAAAADADADLADTAQRLVMFIDNATGLPVTPGGSNITVAWDNGGNRICKL